MSTIFKTTVNNEFDFSVSLNKVENLDVKPLGNNLYHVLHNHKSIKAAVKSVDFNKKTYQVSINNNTYTVAIKNDLDQLIEALGFASGSSKEINQIKAPMPGLILDIAVSEGAEVKEGDTLLILEAMKMENIITSPRDGVIKSVEVAKGNAVDKNQLLVTFQ